MQQQEFVTKRASKAGATRGASRASTSTVRMSRGEEWDGLFSYISGATDRHQGGLKRSTVQPSTTSTAAKSGDFPAGVDPYLGGVSRVKGEPVLISRSFFSPLLFASLLSLSRSPSRLTQQHRRTHRHSAIPNVRTVQAEATDHAISLPTHLNEIKALPAKQRIFPKSDMRVGIIGAGPVRKDP